MQNRLMRPIIPEEIPQASHKHLSPCVWPQTVRQHQYISSLCSAFLLSLPASFQTTCPLSPSPDPSHLDIDWDPTGVSRDKINKESEATNNSLTHPNMKGSIIICQSQKEAINLSGYSHTNNLIALATGVHRMHPKHFFRHVLSVRH